MRISDWSSDVCSSDLRSRRILVLCNRREQRPDQIRLVVVQICDRRHFSGGGEPWPPHNRQRLHPRDHLGRLQAVELQGRLPHQRQNDNGEYDENLADEQLGWGHVGLLAKGAEARLRLLALLSVHSLPLTMCPTCASLRRAQTFRRLLRSEEHP